MQDNHTTPTADAVTHEQVIELAVPCYPPVPVIYFLVREKKVVYVGQTTNLLYRIGSHVRGPKEFDSYYFVPLSDGDDIDEVEADFIAKFEPEYNGQMPPGKRYVKRSGAREMLQKKLGLNLKQRKEILAEAAVYFDGFYNVDELEFAAWKKGW